MLRSQQQILKFAEDAREKPLGMVECPQEQCHDGQYTQQTWPLHKTTTCDTCRGTGLVREPCKMCGGRAAVPGSNWEGTCPDCKDGLAPRVSDAEVSASIQEPHGLLGPDTSGAEPVRVVEVDLTPRRECEACGKYGERMRGTVPLCVAEDRSDDPNHRGTHSCRMVPCPARCDAGWLGWDAGKEQQCGHPEATYGPLPQMHPDGGRPPEGWSCPRDGCPGWLPYLGPPDLTPLLRPHLADQMKPARQGDDSLPAKPRHLDVTNPSEGSGPVAASGPPDVASPLCDVIRLRVPPLPTTLKDAQQIGLYEQQCAEVGVTFIVREDVKGLGASTTQEEK